MGGFIFENFFFSSYQLREANETDMVFPILGKAEATSLHGRYFIPLIETPKVYFITHANHHVLRDVMISCLNLWPMLAITALMVLISGILKCSYPPKCISSLHP